MTIGTPPGFGDELGDVSGFVPITRSNGGKKGGNASPSILLGVGNLPKTTELLLPRKFGRTIVDGMIDPLCFLTLSVDVPPKPA